MDKTEKILFSLTSHDQSIQNSALLSEADINAQINNNKHTKNVVSYIIIHFTAQAMHALLFKKKDINAVQQINNNKPST